MSVILCSFADSRFVRSRNRLMSQALNMGIYDKIFIFDEHDIDFDFINKHKKIINPSVRGYGYWIWKPYFVNKVLSQASDGDVIHYLDAGCWLNKRGHKRMDDYISIIKEIESGILAFKNIHEGGYESLSEYKLPEYMWTKADLFKHFDVLNDDNITMTEQIFATTFFIRKCEHSKNIVEQWLNACENYELISDQPSHTLNFSGFIEHRHDQSIFSILCKKHHVSLLSYFEIFYPALNKIKQGQYVWQAKSDWSKLCDMPILAKRDKDLGMSKKIVNKISKVFHIIMRQIKKQ